MLACQHGHFLPSSTTKLRRRVISAKRLLAGAKSAGPGSARAARFVHLTRRGCLSAAAQPRSEFCGATPDRASRCSRREATYASGEPVLTTNEPIRPPCRVDQAHDRGGSLAGAQAAGEQPVVP